MISFTPSANGDKNYIKNIEENTFASLWSNRTPEMDAKLCCVLSNFRCGTTETLGELFECLCGSCLHSLLAVLTVFLFS